MLSILKKKKKNCIHPITLNILPQVLKTGYSIENQTDRTRERSRVLEGTTLDWFGL